MEFFAYFRSAYPPDRAHLVVKAWFFMPGVMQFTRQIFGPSATFGLDLGLAGGVDLDSLRHGPGGLWLFGDQAQLHDHAPDVQRALRTWVLPFLNASSTLDTFASGPAQDHLRAEVVAAAYVQLGQPGSALDYLQRRVAARSDIASAFLLPLDALAAYLASSRQHPHTPQARPAAPNPSIRP